MTIPRISHIRDSMIHYHYGIERRCPIEKYIAIYRCRQMALYYVGLEGKKI